MSQWYIMKQTNNNKSNVIH